MGVRVLGIDPGLGVTGYGCVDLPSDAIEPDLVEAGVLRLDRRASVATRLAALAGDLRDLIQECAPDHLVVEQVFAHRAHVRTSILMGHARGVILLAAAEAGLEIHELAPAEVKRAIAGSGRASKEQMQQAVAAQCGLDAPPEPHDVADAIALALCGARRLVTARGTVSS